MDACTRPSHTGRQTRMHTAHRLAAFLLTVCVGLPIAVAPALPATSLDAEPAKEHTATVAPSTQHEVTVTQVSLGREMATLSARMSDSSGNLAKNIAWTIRDRSGDTVLRSQGTTAAVALLPGFYLVEATLDGIKLEESFTLLQGHSMTINFVLNAGALRVLPRIVGIDSPGIKTETRIFAMSGYRKGEVVKASAVAGEVINLTAGSYRIESRLLHGNALAVTDINIEPGVMSAVEIDHRAGLARLSYVGAPNAQVEWEIKRGQQSELSNITGLNANIVLRPGSYVAIARVGQERLTATFQIREGEARDIMLGN
jgi:hypothetical protein